MFGSRGSNRLPGRGIISALRVDNAASQWKIEYPPLHSGALFDADSNHLPVRQIA